jgi:hypothetical protein
MKSIYLRNVAIIGLLIVGLLFVYAPRFLAWGAEPESAADFGDYHRYIADLDFWQKTPREATVYAATRFDLNANLADVPATVGNWTGRDVPETNQEVMILLEPEQYVRRLYQDDQGRYIWLSLIGGRSSQPFHAPDICYDADGWQYNLGSHPVALDDGGELYGLWLEAEKTQPGDNDPTEHVVFYFYLFPNAQRDLSEGIVLFKLTSSVYGSVEETLAMQSDFVRHFFVHAE